MSSVLLGAPPALANSRPAASSPPMAPPGRAIPQADGAAPRASSTLSVIAGVGVLLLAMGVGVLIGRSGNAKSSSSPPQVISVASTPAAAPAAAAPEASFTSDWPAGSSGYTVQLQTLPQAGTSVSAVQAATSSATAKGAKAVGALKSEEFSSLTAGSYVIYSGVYSKKVEAQKALGALKKHFPGASVIHVSSGGTGAASTGAAPGASNAPGSSESHPAPPSVLKSLNSTKGKSYEEKSKNLPNVVETG